MLKKPLVIGVISLLLCIAILITVSASSTINTSTKEKVNDGQLLTRDILIQKDGQVTLGQIKIGVDNKTLLKGVEIPQSWKNLSTEKLEPTEKDWAFIKDAIKDLSEEDKNKLINEFKKICEGKSKLSAEEQNEVCQKIAYYTLEATEGGEDGGIQPMWGGYPTHWQLSSAVGPNLGMIYSVDYIASGHVDILGDYSWWADDHRDQPPLTWPLVNRHSWVINDIYVPNADNYGPDSCEYYINNARANFSQYDVNSAYIDIGKGLHYIEDLGCPFHTTGVYGQAWHESYENWVSSHWSQLESATSVDAYYLIDDPSEDAKMLASYSHQYLQPILDILNNDPNWQNSSDLINYTRTLISETEKMTIGTLVYASKFESPNTIGDNSVPVRDFQTSYAYIDNVPCSDSMAFPISIDHTYIGDLEVWIGFWDQDSSSYIDYKIWDHQGGGADNLRLVVHAQGFQNVHNWRLKVTDSAGGDEGAITEFYDLIG